MKATTHGRRGVESIPVRNPNPRPLLEQLLRLLVQQPQQELGKDAAALALAVAAPEDDGVDIEVLFDGRKRAEEKERKKKKEREKREVSFFFKSLFVDLPALRKKLKKTTETIFVTLAYSGFIFTHAFL